MSVRKGVGHRLHSQHKREASQERPPRRRALQRAREGRAQRTRGGSSSARFVVQLLSLNCRLDDNLMNNYQLHDLAPVETLSNTVSSSDSDVSDDSDWRPRHRPYGPWDADSDYYYDSDANYGL